MSTLTNASGRELECKFLYFRDRHRSVMATGATVTLPADFLDVVNNRYKPRLRRSYAAALAGGLISLNDSPTNITLSATSIAENAGANAVVGTLSTTDPNAGNTFTYTLVSGTGSTDNSSFNISGSQLRATASLDFEAQSSYSVRVRSTDQGGLFTEKAFTITVTDVNEAPAPTIVGYVADSSFDAATGTYCPAGTYANSPYYAGSNSDGTSNGWLIYFDADLYGWMLSQTDTPGVSSANGYSANGDPDAPPLTGWYSDTAADLTLTTGTVCFE